MENKEITIAYGNEIQLTTSGGKNKQVYLKLSPAFRNKQLKELKGSALSVFICYALHSDENGYTWIDDGLVKKETGLYRTQEARQILIKKGYLYQERLYDEEFRFRDYIYRIFQPVEKDRIFTIRGIAQKARLSSQNAYTGKMPEQAKGDGLIEEEPITTKEEPISVAVATIYPSLLDELLESKRRDLHVIGLWIREKKLDLPNKEVRESIIRRNLRPAKDLIGYLDDEIVATIKVLANTQYLSKFTLNTVGKYIDEVKTEKAKEGRKIIRFEKIRDPKGWFKMRPVYE